MNPLETFIIAASALFASSCGSDFPTEICSDKRPALQLIAYQSECWHEERYDPATDKAYTRQDLTERRNVIVNTSAAVDFDFCASKYYSRYVLDFDDGSPVVEGMPDQCHIKHKYEYHTEKIRFFSLQLFPEKCGEPVERKVEVSGYSLIPVWDPVTGKITSGYSPCY